MTQSAALLAQEVRRFNERFGTNWTAADVLTRPADDLLREVLDATRGRK